MAIYIMFDGISGDVTTQNYQKWCEVSDIDFTGIHHAINNIIGKAEDRITTRPHFGEIALIKESDSSSIHLFEHSYSGKVIPKVEIHFVSTGNPPTAHTKYLLTNVIISHYSERHFNGSNAMPQEKIRLNYETIQKTYIPRNAQNQLGSPLISGFNLPKASAL